VAAWAEKHDLPCIEAENVNTPETTRHIQKAAPDLLVVIAFGQKVGRGVIELAPHEAINVHASLLPKYRGAAPINWAIMNGEKQTGVSIITLAEKMDAGAILAQKATEIDDSETAADLHDRLAQLAPPVLTDTIDKIAAGQAGYHLQDESQVTLAPKLTKADGCIDFDEPAELVRRKIRGLWSWPGATVLYVSRDGKVARVTIAAADMVRTENPQNAKPGTLDENLNVICSRNRLQIMKVKPEGSKLMTFADFVNGRHVKAGDKFVRIQQ
jgi:methionyl-tRNA formyltransferase